MDEIQKTEQEILDLVMKLERLRKETPPVEVRNYMLRGLEGINALLPHLEDQFSVVLLSKDPPESQRRFANARGWRFRLASHGGGEYIREQSVIPGENNTPGLVCYQREGDRIVRRNASVFGP